MHIRVYVGGEAQSVARTGESFYFDREGDAFIVLNSLEESTPDRFRPMATGRIQITAKGSSNHPAEGVYEKEHMKAVVEHYVDNHGHPVWGLELNGQAGLIAATAMFREIRSGQLQPVESWVSSGDDWQSKRDELKRVVDELLNSDDLAGEPRQLACRIGELTGVLPRE